MTNDELAGFILPWAKQWKPEPYAATVAVAGRPVAFRKYMLRLVELRYTEERSFRLTVPLSVLEETGLTQRMRLPDGDVIEVKGKEAGERQWGFGELQHAAEQGWDLPTLLMVKRELDLVLDDEG